MKFTEKALVEDYIVQKLCEVGWTFRSAEALERESYEEPLLIPNLVRALGRINKDIQLADEEVNKVINELKLASTGIEGIRKILNFYKFGVPVKFDREKVVRYVSLFDFERIDKNEFIVTRQVNFQGKDRIRTDIILYVNGIPLVSIECKNPASISESWWNAYVQIKDYERLVPELYKYVQIGVAAESVARYFPIVPWQEEVRNYEWRADNKDSIDSVVQMLSTRVFPDILKNFLFFRVELGQATKVITRYMQYRAANRMVERVVRNLNHKEEKNKGLIWHWQGSGKTLTMIFTANKLYYDEHLANPSIFFLVDRTQLEGQLEQEFNALDLVKPEVIGSISALKRVLQYDDYRGKRGVFIVLIHKFRPEEFHALQAELEEISKHKETIMTRKNLIAFIDEGHRTQYGLLAAQMKAIFKNAFFFALTGTPIAKRGRDTYREFSYPPDESYLDSYLIRDSIEDGFTLKIVYQPRLEKEVHLKKALLEGFLESEYEEIPEEFRKDVKEEVKKRLNEVNVFLEDPGRIKVIAEDIARHFKENVNGKFKAMVVAGSRRACVMYKRELDKYLAERYSQPIMTSNPEDRGKRKEVHRYVAEARAKYGGRDFEDIRKDFVEKFKEEEFPRILIVTEMLLTGFDAPVLQTMYLDKPLKEHRLLQAVARTNRPFKGLKEAGVVIDYVGVLKEYKKALAMYSAADIKGVLYDFENLEEEFLTLLKDILVIFLGVPRDFSRESLLQAVEVLTSEEKAEANFLEKYKKLQRVFEILGPAELKLEFLEEYKWILAVYAYYQKLVVQKPVDEVVLRKYFDKTLRFIHKTTEITTLEKDLPVLAFDEKYLERLEREVQNRKERAANILFTLNRLVLVERHRNPVFESLVERVERLLEMWRQKNRDYRMILEGGVEAANSVFHLLARQKSLDFTDLEYAVLLNLESKVDTEDDFVSIVRNFIQGLKPSLFSGWHQQVTVQKKVEREIRRFVRGIKGRYRLSLDEMNRLHEMILESVMNYGIEKDSP